MSAIAGIYHPQQKHLVDSNDLRQMVNILAHRGPDGSNDWCEDYIGFGHRMLWSTPESLVETMPLVRNNIAITADARIDNRSELLELLHFDGRPAEKVADSEIILAAYETWGEQCPDKLLGDFAFAIWDSREEKLFCARDHFGVKPFYYYTSDTLVAFATEIKAILCLDSVPRQLNETRVGDYLAAMFHDTAMTSYQNIFRLPPAHRMVVRSTQVEISSYWGLDPERELPPASDEEYAAKFREIFTEAVDCRLRSAYPVGTTLSGGLDSSSITCVARDLLAQKEKEPLNTFSAVFDDMPECDEREYTAAIFKQGGLNPYFVQGNNQTPLENIDQMFWYQDEAFYAPNWFMTWPLYDKARQQGVRILLDGFDGDNTVSDGYGYLSELARDSRWLLLYKEIRALSKNWDSPTWPLLWQYIFHFGLNRKIEKVWLLRGIRKVLRRAVNLRKKEQTPAWDALLDPDFVKKLDLKDRHEEWRKRQGHSGLTERQRHYCNIATQGTSSFALEVMDKKMAAFSIEPRYPFWDKRLVEFCLALPADQKLKEGWNRVIMRRAMAGILPPEVQWRRGKTDFSPNLTMGIVNNRAQLAAAVAHLSYIEKYVDVSALEDMHKKLLEDPSHKNSRQLWLALSLALWRRYVVGKGVLPTKVLSTKQCSSESTA